MRPTPPFIQVVKVLPTALAAILLLIPQTKQAISALLSLTAQDVALLVILLPTATIFILLSTSTSRSVFSTPGQLVRLLKSLTDQHLAPYAAGAALIVHECLRQQQVYVVGPAGVGKSTLVERLVVAELSRECSVLPIYMRQIDDDTPNVDEVALAIAVRSAIKRDGLQDKFGEMPAGDSPFDVLDRLVERHRIPLLIFDHFDDYLAANLHWISVRDMSGTADLAVRAPIQSSEIRQQSAFWERLATRVAKNSLKTIYVVTPDLISFVSSFRFGTRVVQCPAFELQVAEADAYMSQLELELDKLSTPIKQPDDGWTLLKRRLLADLAPRQTCLPHQLNVALQGLANLPFATLGAYVANGGLLGLSASTVDVVATEIANTEVASSGTESWSPEYVLLLCAGLSLLSSRRGSVEQALGQAASAMPDGPLVKLPTIDDPRWEASMLRLRARRLVRLTREASADGAVYELRHPYIGVAARAALQRRAPLEAELMRHAARHSAAASWVEWWRTLLPTLQLARLLWASLRTGFRFRGHQRYALESLARVGVWGLIGMTFVLLADAGMALPFGDATRKAVDNFGVTIFRQPVDAIASVDELKVVRDRLGEVVVQRCQATKWCQSVDGTSQLHEEPWATSQALAAVLGFPNGKAAERPWLPASLQAMFASKHKVSEGERTVGWTLGDLSSCPVAEPSLWMGLALARVSGNSLRSPELEAKLPRWNVEVGQAVDSHSLGSRVNPAPFIEFVANTQMNSLAPPSVYATSLSLLRDLDRAAYDDTARLRIESTVKWLLEHMKAHGDLEPADGWQPAFVSGHAISAGVTMQVLYGLLRARQFVPNAVPEGVTTLALRWLQSFENEEDPFLESVSFYYGECKVGAATTSFGHVVRFLWYPWAIGAALELHQYEAKTLSRGQRLVVARALEHFQQLSKKGFPSAKLDKLPTYKLSEFLFAMASAK